MTNFSDAPITTPDMDLYGFNDFAQSIAKSLIRIQNSSSAVIALNGKWGAGKSSTINLIKHHLNELDTDKNFKIKNFHCWWIRGQESLLLAFFHELHSMIKDSRARQAMKYVSKIASYITQLKQLAIAGANVAAPGVGGAAAGTAFTLLDNFIKSDQDIDQAYEELRAGLSKSDQKFLIIIDDIDRLFPDEALLIFQLVKTLGNLPNVFYLLAYDRDLSEKNIQKIYGLNDQHYLEKIVQVSFDLPQITEDSLDNQTLSTLQEIHGPFYDDDAVANFWKYYIDIIKPEIKNPRDIIRYCNALTLTWPSVSEELNFNDFASIEALRLFKPDLYKSICNNKKLLTEDDAFWPKEDKKNAADNILQYIEEKDQSRARTVLMRLFPLLQGIWGNVIDKDFDAWRRGRRICHKETFDAYFALSYRNNVVHKKDIESIFDLINNDETEKAKNKILNIGQDATMTMLLLEDLRVNTHKIVEGRERSFIKSLFSIADRLYYTNPKPLLHNTFPPIFWIINSIKPKFSDQDETDDIFLDACSTATFGWLSYFTDSNWRDHYKEDEENQASSKQPLLSRSATDELCNQFLSRVTLEIDSLLPHLKDEFLAVLYTWKHIANDDGASVKNWCREQLNDDNKVVLFADILPTIVHSSSSRFKRISDTDIRSFFDVETFLNRVRELLDNPDLSAEKKDTLEEFMTIYESQRTSQLPPPVVIDYT